MRVTCQISVEELGEKIGLIAPAEARLLSKADFLKRVYALLDKKIGEGIAENQYEFRFVEDLMNRMIEDSMRALVDQYAFAPMFLESAFLEDPQVLHTLDFAVGRTKEGLDFFGQHLGKLRKMIAPARREAERMRDKEKAGKEN